MNVDQGQRLRRSKKERILAGVCGGVAEYFSIDPVLVRLLWAAFALLEGAGILLYIVAWIIMPEGEG
ncbi:MAG: PspC domain-containing protein [Bacillota bacterium]